MITLFLSVESCLYCLCSAVVVIIMLCNSNVELFYLRSGLSAGRGFGPSTSTLMSGRASELHADDQLLRRYRGMLSATIICLSVLATENVKLVCLVVYYEDLIQRTVRLFRHRKTMNERVHVKIS